MIPIILTLFLKLCLAQDYPPPNIFFQENDYSRFSLKTQNDKSTNNFRDWKNNFDNNVIIPDAYVLNFLMLIK